VARLDVRVLIRYVCIFCIAFEPEEIVFSVYHAIEENGGDTSKEGMERWDEVDVFSKCKPELAGFESDVLVFIFGGVEHVFCDVWHFWHEFVGTGCEKEDESLADVATDKGVVIRSAFEETSDKSVDVDKERLAVYGDKVGETGDCVCTHLWVGMFCELEEFGNHVVEWPGTVYFDIHLAWIVLAGFFENVERRLESQRMRKECEW
jgi:hypothetical protein